MPRIPMLAAVIVPFALALGGGEAVSHEALALGGHRAVSHEVSPTTSFLGGLTRSSKIASTVPANGDVNPYGVALVPSSTGKLKSGDVLVSNFNDKANEQGTGTTIVQITPTGRLSVFAHITQKSLPGSCPGGVGLTTALVILPDGYVVVGSLPTTNGMSATARYGCLIVVNPSGHAVATVAGPLIQGPWDMAAVTQGTQTTLFVSMVLNGGAAKGRHRIDNSTVVRITLSTPPGQAPKVLGEQVIADGIPWRDDPAALVIGPTGVALSADGTLYVADTLDNRIAAVADALTRSTPAPDAGSTVSQGGHLKQPLGLILAPNGDILTANAGDGNIVETTPAGKQLNVRTAVAKNGAGSLFGLSLTRNGRGLVFVDDADNTLRQLSP